MMGNKQLGFLLDDEETEALYKQLKPIEENLCQCLSAMISRLEKYLYSRMSIHELEVLVIKGEEKK